MKINIIGCGGTGGYVVPNVLRLLREKDRLPELELYDDDYVEERNIPRQNFCYADIGRPKVEVLAERYSAVFGVPITTWVKSITGSDFSYTERPDLWISCVDNNFSRRMIIESGERVLDVGNELKYGQVFYHHGNYNIYYVHPEIKEDKEGSCSDTPGQSFLINYIAANAVTIFLNHLIDTVFTAKYYELTFDVLGNMRTIKNEEYEKYKKLAHKVTEKKTGKKVKETKKGDVLTSEELRIGLKIKGTTQGGGTYTGVVVTIKTGKQGFQIEGAHHYILFREEDDRYYFHGIRGRKEYPVFIDE